MTQNSTLTALCFAGVYALLAPFNVCAEPTAQPSAHSTDPTATLDDLEARAPKDWSNRQLIAEINARVISLVEANTLTSAADFFRAAKLANKHLREFRVGRVHYELMLAAAAKGDQGAEVELHASWDILLTLLGRPFRIDAFGAVAANPDFYQLDAAPACIQAVLRDPAGARAKLATTGDNPEIKTIVDADQQVRKSNWDALTGEQRKAISDGDRQRNARMRAIVSSGEIHTANDFARASLVMQHSANFAGFQLAHELAVCSMLLGDRQTGRWLIAATYDRMLHSVGHDQRFGTQMGPDGPLRVDESGICDGERQAVGCPTLAQARTRRRVDSHTVSTLAQELIGSGNSVHDAKNQVSATFPPSWTIAGAAPAGERATSISFKVPEHADASLGFYYRIHPAPFAVPANDPEEFLREEARKKALDRLYSMPDYRNRAESFVFRQINGQPSASWIADYTRDGRKWSEYLTRILGQSSIALLFLNAPAEELEGMRSAVDGMSSTVRLP